MPVDYDPTLAEMVANGAAGAYKAAVPINFRAFVQALVGGKKPITEKDMWPSDLEALRHGVKNAVLREELAQDVHDRSSPVADYWHPPGDYPKGYMGYGDYHRRKITSDPRLGEDRAEGLPTGEASMWVSMDERPPLNIILEDSFRRPDFRLDTFLGRAKYERDANGDTIVTDRYDFDMNRTSVDAISESQGKMAYVYDQFRKRGVAGALLAIGNVYGPPSDDAENGIPVRINLGKVY